MQALVQQLLRFSLHSYRGVRSTAALSLESCMKQFPAYIMPLLPVPLAALAKLPIPEADLTTQASDLPLAVLDSLRGAMREAASSSTISADPKSEDASAAGTSQYYTPSEFYIGVYLIVLVFQQPPLPFPIAPAALGFHLHICQLGPYPSLIHVFTSCVEFAWERLPQALYTCYKGFLWLPSVPVLAGSCCLRLQMHPRRMALCMVQPPCFGHSPCSGQSPDSPQPWRGW